MNKKVIIGLLICILYFPVNLIADNSYYYSENTGWHNFNQVNVSSSALTGWIWAENIGWIMLDPPFGGVSIDANGQCAGYAYGENVGWINFSPIEEGVKADPAANALQGWAWGENIGWIYFDSIIISFSKHALRIIPNYVKAGESDTAKIILGDDDVKPGTQFKITILTISGRRIVREFPQISYEKLNIGLTWDLKDNDGKVLPSGVYTVFVTGGGKEYKKAFYFRK